MYQGDYKEDFADLNLKFLTRNTSSVPTSLLGSPVISVYKSNNLTQSVAGVTLTVDFDGVTGLNNVKIDLSSDAFYATAEDYQVIITTGTVDGVSVVGEVVSSFSIENRFDVVSLSATGLDAIVSTASGMVEIAKAVWDRVLTGATHNVNNSSGKRVRQLASVIIRNELAQGAGTGNNQIQLDTGASSTDGAYDPILIAIVSGTGLGQTRLILQYDGTTKTATVDRNWKVNPDATSEFNLIADAGRNHVNEGLAQTGTSNTITLNTLASSGNDAYIGQIVFLRSGTGDDQAGTIISYNGTTKVATIDRNWITVPDTTTAYTIIPASPVILASTTHTGAIIPTVTTVTNQVTVVDILTTQMTESYAADGVAPTLAQGIFNIQQNLGDFVFSGTTQTVRKLDGSTTAATYTLDDATSPTAKTRTT